MKKFFLLFFIIMFASLGHSATISVVNNLDFGTITVHPSGEVIRIDASAGSAAPVIYSGGTSRLSGGISGRIRFIPDAAGQIVRIFYPVSLTLTSASNSMIINQFSSNSTNTFTTPSTSPVDFYIGGILYISSDQPAGNYSGTMTITINATIP